MSELSKCPEFNKLLVEELRKEPEYIEGHEDDEPQTYAEEQEILTEAYKKWQEDLEVRKGKHLKECTHQYCVNMRKVWASEPDLAKYVQ